MVRRNPAGQIYGKPFFGVVLDAPISSFEITGYYEIAYHLDNIRWAPLTAPVPEPSTAMLLALELGCLTIARRANHGQRGANTPPTLLAHG